MRRQQEKVSPHNVQGYKMSSIGQISALKVSHWLGALALHFPKQTMDKHNKIIRSGILIVLTLGSLSDMESLDNSLKTSVAIT